MTDTMFTRTALAEAAEKAGVTPDQARTILEAAGVKVEPEKPALPTEPGDVIIATEVRGEADKWVLVLDDIGEWFSAELISGRQYHRPHHITAWTEAVVVPVAAAPVTLTEEEVGRLYDAVDLGDTRGPWEHLPADSLLREHVTATANALLAKYAAPAEDVPDWDDVRNAVASQRGNGWSLNDAAINGITDAVMRLLHREEV